MATITSTRLSYKNAGNITDTQCIRIVRKDGEILRFTDAVNDLVMSDYVDSDGIQLSLPSDVTYTSIGFKSTATSSGRDMSPGSVDLESILSVTTISRSDLKKGLYNQARVYIFYTNYNDPVEDDEKVITGFWGQATINDGTYSITFNSLIDVLNTRTGKSSSPTCTARLGDDRCGVRLTPENWSSSTAYIVLDTNDAKLGTIVTPIVQTGFFYICTDSGTSDATEPTWPITVDGTVNDGSVEWTAILPYTQTGILTSVVDRFGFVDTDRTEPDDWWTQGKIVFTSGTNEGMTFDIKQSFLAFNSISTKQKAPFDFEVGDTYTITTGCRKRLAQDCIGEFKNVYNNQSIPWIPGRSVVGKFGGQ